MADNLYAKLSRIQQQIKVPKDQNNDFAGFKYRSAEDILEKLKPQLALKNVLVVLSDKLEVHGEQAYIKAEAKMIDLESEESISVYALAREEKTRPKMSEGQLTGAASSYARKYALNGLLLLDDNKDPDSQDNTQSHSKPADKPTNTSTATEGQKKFVMDLLEQNGVSREEANGFLTGELGVEVPLTFEGAQFAISELKDRLKQPA